MQRDLAPVDGDQSVIPGKSMSIVDLNEHLEQEFA